MFELIERWRGYEIHRRLPGFEFTPVLLGKICSYVVLGGSGSPGVFAFMYRFGILRGRPDSDEALLAEMALDVIKESVSASDGKFGGDRTFELGDGRWTEVERPAWWVASFD